MRQIIAVRNGRQHHVKLGGERHLHAAPGTASVMMTTIAMAADCILLQLGDVHVHIGGGNVRVIVVVVQHLASTVGVVVM